MATKAKSKTAPKKAKLFSLRECTILRRMCDSRIEKLRTLIDNACGSLYPGIWGAEIEEIEKLFEKITGFPLSLEAE